MAYTLAEFRTFLSRNNAEDTSDKGIGLYDSIANRINNQIRQLGKWDFDKTVDELVFSAAKTAGTITSVTTTAVVGSGTAWAAGDVGSYFRFNGQAQIYRVSAVGGATGATLLSTYRGAAIAAGTSYELLDIRKALPARFRCFEKPILEDGSYRLDPMHDIRNMLQAHRLVREVSARPREYAIEWAVPDGASTGYKAPYMWINPAPEEQIIIPIAYYRWPSKLSADAHDFGLPDLAACDELIEELGLAHLKRYQKDYAGSESAMSYALKLCEEALGAFRSVTEAPQREMYDPAEDVGLNRWHEVMDGRPWASGEPTHP